MVTAFNIMFSKAAAARIMCCADSEVMQVRKFAFVAWVWVRSQRPRFVSFSLFKAAFVQRRMGAGAALKAERWVDVPHWFTVRNEKKSSRYPVVLAQAGPVCRCEDFKNQQQFFGKGVCKHGYSVLQLLGFGSLSAYLAA